MIRQLEAVLKMALEEPFARLFPGKLHPLELAASLRATALANRLHAAEGTFVANAYSVFLSPQDYEQMATIGEAVTDELGQHLAGYAETEGWHIGPYVSVQLMQDEDLRLGQIRTQGDFAACPQTAFVQVEAGYAQQERHDIGAEAVLGRNIDCDIVLQTPEISRRHCRISYTYVEYEIEDLSSANGTFVNGEPVERSPLYHGDLIEVGLIQLRFHVE